MAGKWPVPIEGGCSCGALRYRLERAPMFINCCSCQTCQRETGTAFALNAIVEADQVVLLPGNCGGSVVKPRLVMTPSDSGRGQLIVRCPYCFVAVWSFYSGAGPYIKFLRGGTLDKCSVQGASIEDILRPDIFIYTKFKQPWVTHPEEAARDGLVMNEFYDMASEWPKEAYERFLKTRPPTDEWKARGSRWEEIIGDSPFTDCRQSKE